MKIGEKIKFKVVKLKPEQWGNSGTVPIKFEVGEEVTVVNFSTQDGWVRIKESPWTFPLVCFIPNFKSTLYISNKKIQDAQRQKGFASTFSKLKRYQTFYGGIDFDFEKLYKSYFTYTHTRDIQME